MNVPSGVTEITGMTFFGCVSLPVINGIRYADTYMVAAADKTQNSYTIQEGTKWIGDAAFEDCSSVTSITLPSSILSIGASVFRGCTSLTSVTIDNNAHYASVDGVLYTIALDTILLYPSAREEADIIIPNHVSVVETGAYADNQHIKSLYVPENVKKIFITAFSGCDSLTKLTIASPAIVEAKYDKSYNTLNGFFSIFGSPSKGTILTECIIESPISVIGDACFEECNELQKVTLPETIKRIEDGAFLRYSKLQEINLPNGLTSIGSQAFMDCPQLSNMHLPDSLSTLGIYAFYGCHALTNVQIPSSLTALSNSVFRASGLKYVHIPSNITTIDAGAFMACKQLQGVRFSERVKNLMYGAFSYTDLKYIICEALTPPSCVNECFQDVNYAIPLYVPADSISVYQSAAPWSKFTNIQGIAYAETVDVAEDFAIDTNDSSVTFVWQVADSAILYSLEITSEDSTVFQQWFTQDAILMDTTVHVSLSTSTTNQAPMVSPARINKANENDTFGISYSITNLQSNSHYHYQLKALNSAYKVVQQYNGVFTTNVAALDEISDESLDAKTNSTVRKVIRNNKVYIIHSQDIFDISGSKTNIY